MINKIPDNWDYKDDLEMLFLFYQSTDELLSEVTTDTYALPLHNTLSLFLEIDEIYRLLKRNSIIEKYYEQYIPPIIEEFLKSLEDDYLLKKMLGKRQDLIKTGFTECLKNSILLERWLESFMQLCTLGRYKEAYENEIIHLVTQTNDKQKLLYCLSNYYVHLISIGYSREYIYICAKKYFDNKNKRIKSLTDIKGFLDIFSCQEEEYEFLVLLDIDSIEYIDSISDDIQFSRTIEKLDLSKERIHLLSNPVTEEVVRLYDKLKSNHNKHSNISLVRMTDISLDPYSAASSFINFVNTLQSYSRYFTHYSYSRQVFRILLKEGENHYRKIREPRILRKRPIVEQSVMDTRIKNVFFGEAMERSANTSIAKAIIMHSEAFDSKTETTLIRTLWTALETLFSNPTTTTTKENAINSVLPIIQKTYILKRLRSLYYQLNHAVDKAELEKLDILSFNAFVIYFSSYSACSPEMKSLYALLSKNPLLRSRIYETRKEFSTGCKISDSIKKHETRIIWQLKRIYRIRNIATHLGNKTTGIETAVNHLHNYFDYIINYLLCKSENGDYVVSTSSVVFESKNDVQMHLEMLKTEVELSSDNYMEFLFGPDSNLINYYFEF